MTDNQQMTPGIQLNPDVLQAVTQSQLAEQAVQIAQLTAGCQQLIMENGQLQEQLQAALLKVAELEGATDGDESEDTVKAKRKAKKDANTEQ